ncbi:MAG: FAD-binding oxidoreductase [Deltaproteobacteria bacterium]|nr:FAD-binding oxidoreductase [Deltaproteobacteria bacterium]
MGRAVGELLGVEALEPQEPRPIDLSALDPAGLEVPAQLSSFVSLRAEDRFAHARGKSYPELWDGFLGRIPRAPDAVAFPELEREIVDLLEWCERTDVAVIPFGGGTSVVRGVEAPHDRASVSLDLSRMCSVSELDPVSRVARIEAGATGPALEAQLGAKGMTLRHYPQSFERSTLGGWIATRAAGHFATGPTRIDAFVESARMVSPSGILETPRVPSAGAVDARGWVLGSEGAFGVITEAWVRVRPRPRFRARASARFDDFLRGAEAVRAIVQAGLEPANCRLLDPVESAIFGVSSERDSVLVLSGESSACPLDAWLSAATSFVREQGGRVTAERASISDRPEDDAKWRSAFFEGPYLQNVMVSLGVVADTFETSVTWDRFPRLYSDVVGAVEQVIRARAGVGRVSCRLTHAYPDGPAPYFTFLTPSRPRAAALELWTELKSAASEAVLSAGGTITHHHAIGRVHRPWHVRERGELASRVLAAQKLAFDPKGIMNPEVLVPLEKTR